MTTWIKDTYPGGISIWDDSTLPWQLALPWQYGSSGTVWTLQINLS